MIINSFDNFNLKFENGQMTPSDVFDMDECYINRVDIKDLRERIHRYVDGNLQSELYSDHDPDEPSVIRYFAIDENEIKEITELNLLVHYINEQYDIFELIEEYYL